jgi:hypothetical protein
MSDAPLVAHSLAEAYLYILATSCASCGCGPLRGGEAELANDVGDAGAVSIAATCGSCQGLTRLRFRLPTPPESIPAQQAPVVNPTDEPSRILDVAQWLTLFRMLTETADHEASKSEARQLALEAAQCLDEALKFYDDADNDLPPVEAFFGKDLRARFKAHPEQFSRRRLLHLRSKLPTPWPMRPGGRSEGTTS